MDEARLIDKLKRIEALYAGAMTAGERAAAGYARERILERLKEFETQDPPIEYRFSMPDMWSRKVFVALLRRYGIRPYRYHGQRYTTVMARMPKRFADETLWPEFNEISETLRSYLADVTDRIVHQVIHQDSSEAEVRAKAEQLPLEMDEKPAPERPPANRASERPKQAGPAAAASAGTSRQTGKRRKRKKRRHRR